MGLVDVVVDPRLAVVGDRLSSARRVVPVTGGKGGIGKSVVASLLAVVLAGQGKRVGLLDLDLTGPCDHLILGVNEHVPVEKFGIDPQPVDGIGFMSVSMFAGSTPAPLRGDDLSNALLEILAITRWGELDLLLLDMPPGLGDTALDAARLIPRAEYLAVANASHVVLETVRRNLTLIGELDATLLGVIENMQRAATDRVHRLASECGAPYLGAVPWDEGLEEALGSIERLAATRAAAALTPIARALVGGD